MKTQISILVHRVNIDRHMIEFLSNEIEKFVNELSSNYLDLIMIDEDFYAKKFLKHKCTINLVGKLMYGSKQPSTFDQLFCY